jgi:hypothetical protein
MKDLLSKVVLVGKSTSEVLINFVFPRRESAALFVALTETDIAKRAKSSIWCPSEIQRHPFLSIPLALFFLLFLLAYVSHYII